MYNEWQIGVGMIGYGVWIVLMNWMYIKEYIKDKGVIKRGEEWEN